MNGQVDARLDTVQGCLNRLGEIDAEIEDFRVNAYKAAGQLAAAEKEWQDRYKVAMKAVRGSNADERAAICQQAVKESAPGLWERIVELTRVVKENDRRYEYLDTQRSIVQSCLKTHRGDAERLEPARYGESFGRRAA